MSTTQACGKSHVLVRVAEDLMSATIAVGADAAEEGVEAADVIDAVADAGFAADDDLKRRVAALADADGRIRVTTPVVVREGTPPVHDTPGSFELLATRPDEKASSHYERSNLVVVQTGGAVARLTPVARGTDGIDVFGRPVARRRAADVVAVAGRNVALDADGVTFVAAAPGSVHFDGRTLSINTFLELAGHVDFATGNIDFTGDVSVGGNVTDLFKVKAHSVSVAGTVEAADVEASQDLQVLGGIVAKEKGVARAGRDVTAKHVSNATVRAGRHVLVQSEITNSRVVCGGRADVLRGQIIAGHLTATGGVECRVLGSPSQTATVVEVGSDDDYTAACAAKLEQLGQKTEKIAKVRTLVGPLMANPKKLTAAQKEKATELLYEANELDQQVQLQLAELRRDYDELLARSKAEVYVLETVHPGVVVRLPTHEAKVRDTLRGPLRFVLKEIENEKRIVAVQTNTGRATPLVTHERENPTLENLQRLLFPPAA